MYFESSFPGFWTFISDLEAQINDIRIRKTMPGGAFSEEEVFNKFGGSDGFNYNSSQGHDDDDIEEGSESESDDEGNGVQVERNGEGQSFKGKYHRLKAYIKELVFVSENFFIF